MLKSAAASVSVGRQQRAKNYLVVRSSERRRGGTRKLEVEFERAGARGTRGQPPGASCSSIFPALGHILTHIDSLGDTLCMGSRETLLLPRGSRARNYSAASNPFALIPVSYQQSNFEGERSSCVTIRSRGRGTLREGEDSQLIPRSHSYAY